MTDAPSKASKQILAILMVGTFIGFLNQTLMNTALPDVMAEFHINAALGQWMTNGYMLVNGVMVPLTAFLIQRFTTRQLYLSALVIFGAGTILAGVAPNYPVLITGRMIQALGGGIFAPLMNVVIMNLFPVEHRGHAMGIIGLALNFAPTLGPTVSGWIVTYLSWRYLFFMVAPLVILDLMMAFFLLRNIGEQRFLKFDFLGVVLSSLGLGSLLVGFSNAGAGLVLLPGSLVTALLSPVSGALYDKYGARNLTLIGLLINTIGTIALGLMNFHTGIIYIMMWQLIRQVGLVIVTMPIQTEAFSALPLRMVPDGSAAFTTIRQLAASFGTAVLVTIMLLVANQASDGGHVTASAQLSGIQVTYFVATALVIVAAGLTRFLKVDGHYHRTDENVA